VRYKKDEPRRAGRLTGDIGEVGLGRGGDVRDSWASQPLCSAVGPSGGKEERQNVSVPFESVRMGRPEMPVP
jgi:hypothetical protein